MKKKIALILSISSIIICGWFFMNSMHTIDLLPNYTNQIAAFDKKEIDLRTDINECEKSLLKKEIDLDLKKKREISNHTFKTQIVVVIIMVIQLFLIIIIAVMPKNKKV